MTIVDELNAFLEEHADKYKMSFGLEYSCVIDWVADFTPRRGHPQARDYPLWQAGGATFEEAVHRAMEVAREGIRVHEEAML